MLGAFAFYYFPYALAAARRRVYKQVLLHSQRRCAALGMGNPAGLFCHAHRRDAAMGVTGENAASRRFTVFTQATLNHLCPAPLCGAGHEEQEIPAGLLRLRVSRFAIDRILSKRSLSIGM